MARRAPLGRDVSDDRPEYHPARADARPAPVESTRARCKTVLPTRAREAYVSPERGAPENVAHRKRWSPKRRARAVSQDASMRTLVAFWLHPVTTKGIRKKPSTPASPRESPLAASRNHRFRHYESPALPLSYRAALTPSTGSGLRTFRCRSVPEPGLAFKRLQPGRPGGAREACAIPFRRCDRCVVSPFFS